MAAILAATIVFGKRAEKAAFSQVDGQPGAAAAALNMLRRGWTVTPAVAVTRNQDIVHRVTGRPGVVLVGEGSPTRLGNLLAAEKKKVARYVPEVPIYDLQAGNESGQVPLRKLNSRLMKLPRNLKNDQVIEVNRRLKALGTMHCRSPRARCPRTCGCRGGRAADARPRRLLLSRPAPRSPRSSAARRQRGSRPSAAAPRAADLPHPDLQQALVVAPPPARRSRPRAVRSHGGTSRSAAHGRAPCRRRRAPRCGRAAGR